MPPRKKITKKIVKKEIKENIMAEDKKKKVNKLSKSSKENIKGIDSRAIQLTNRVLAKSSHDFGIPQYGGFRTAQIQNNLFHNKTRITFVDGFKKISYHQSGMAWDIFIYDEHGACWNCVEKYKEVADLFKAEFELMKEEGIFLENEELRWGGDWKRFKDRPHFEIRKVA